MRAISYSETESCVVGDPTCRFHFPAYDYVLAVQTLHHLLRDTKSDLYKKIGKSLKPAGRFINADDMVSAVEEERRPAEYGYDRSRYSERLPF